MKDARPGGRQPVRIALVGCGRIAERAHLPALQHLPEVKLEAIIDPREERRRVFARFVPGCRQFESTEACLAAVPLDAVVVATQPESHLSAAMSAVRQGLAVLIEKPLAPCMEGVAEFEAACRSSGAMVAIGFNRRFWRPVNDLLNALTDSTRSTARVELFQSSDLATWAAIDGPADLLTDLAPHQFDLLRYLMQQEVASVAARWVDPDSLEFTLQFETGARAQGRAAFRTGGRADEWISLGGWWIDLRSDRYQPRRGMIRSGLDTFDAVVRRTVGRRLSILDSYRLQLADFAACVTDHRTPRATLADGIAAVRCVEAARRSAALAGTRIQP